MAQIKISELDERTDFDDSCEIPLDDTIQSWKVPATKIWDWVLGKLAPDDETIEFNGDDELAVKDLGITTAKIAALAVTRPKLAAVGQQISSASPSDFSSTSSSYVDVTNLSVSLTTSGRPVLLMLKGDTEGSTISQVHATGSNNYGIYRFLRDATTVENYALDAISSGLRISWPPGSFLAIDTPAAGTYTYKFQVKSPLGATIRVYSLKLVAFEL